MGSFIGIRSKKRLGQVFLISESVAEAEAAHCDGKVVIEVGPGTGMLTRELLKYAKKVIAVEKDRQLYTILKYEVRSKRLVLINKDFMKATDSELDLKNADIMISNIPYNLSSSIIGWLAEKQMQAVLCLQKEFVEHMLAEPDTHNYSKLSVMTSLLFKVTKIMDVPRGSFRPIPKVDSVVVYLKPLGIPAKKREIEIMGFMMQHKKKTLRNAVMDSRSALGVDKERIVDVAEKVKGNDRRVFKMAPNEILESAGEINKLLK